MCFIGDNKESNIILGFVRSFSANYYCRDCRLHKRELQKTTDDKPENRRNRMNYEEDLFVNDQSKTGVREYSALNNIPHFHVTDSSSIDLTHSVDEGICHYNFGEILYYFIYQKEYFTLEILNERIQSFSYGEDEKSNVASSITKKHLLNNDFKMTAAEMSTFAHNITFLIGDLVPEDDIVWYFLLTNIKFIDYCYLPSYSNQDLKEWTELISEMNNLYMDIFGTTMKPVHHQSIHLPVDTLKYGPLRYTRTIRYVA